MVVLKVTRGDTRRISVTAYDDAGSALDLSNVSEAIFTVKKKRSDSDLEALISKTLDDGIAIDDADAGELTVTLAPTDTSSMDSTARGLPWDLQIKMATGEVYTLASGLMTVSLDVTRDT